MHSLSGQVASVAVRNPPPAFGLQVAGPRSAGSERGKPPDHVPARTITFSRGRPISAESSRLPCLPQPSQRSGGRPAGAATKQVPRSCCWAFMTGTCFPGWVPRFHPKWIFALRSKPTLRCIRLFGRSRGSNELRMRVGALQDTGAAHSRGPASRRIVH